MRWDKRRISYPTSSPHYRLIGYRYALSTHDAAVPSRFPQRASVCGACFVTGFGMMQVMMYLPAS